MINVGDQAKPPPDLLLCVLQPPEHREIERRSIDRKVQIPFSREAGEDQMLGGVLRRERREFLLTPRREAHRGESEKQPTYTRVT